MKSSSTLHVPGAYTHGIYVQNSLKNKTESINQIKPYILHFAGWICSLFTSPCVHGALADKQGHANLNRDHRREVQSKSLHFLPCLCWSLPVMCLI